MKTNDFEKIIINDIPLMDVRAPIEYEKGAFINSTNLPLMNNEERRLVGICYKEEGSESATKLGHQLVFGEIKDQRIAEWKKFITEHPNAILYCFRGGQRSQITQQWLKKYLDLSIPRIDGGYKAFRNYLLSQLEPESQRSTPIILGGYTGSGKTVLLNEIDYSVDLEGIANHRGSSFGNYLSPQPTQINFENNLAYALVKHRHNNHPFVLLEDEGRNVGQRFLPTPLVEHYNKADIVILNVSIEERTLRTLDEYVSVAQKQLSDIHGEEKGLTMWYEMISNNLLRVKKRLGGNRLKVAQEMLSKGMTHQLNTGDTSEHFDWIHYLLQEYYDPMYMHGMKKTNRHILFSGNYDEVLDYLKNKK